MTPTDPRLQSAGRRGSLLLAANALLTLAGCAAAPPASQPPSSAQQSALRSLGFAPTQDGWELDMSARMSFRVDDSRLGAGDLDILGRIAAVLRSAGIEHITVEGHADDQGSEPYNLQLSERRAQTVAQALAERGMAPGNIVRRGLGSARPVADNTTPGGRARNRRAVLIVESL